MKRIRLFLALAVMAVMLLTASAAPAMAHHRFDRVSKIIAGGNVTNAAGNGGNGGQCVGIANTTTVGPGVACNGGNGGNATMRA